MVVGSILPGAISQSALCRFPKTTPPLPDTMAAMVVIDVDLSLGPGALAGDANLACPYAGTCKSCCIFLRIHMS